VTTMTGGPISTTMDRTEELGTSSNPTGKTYNNMYSRDASNKIPSNRKAVAEIMSENATDGLHETITVKYV